MARLGRSRPAAAYLIIKTQKIPATPVVAGNTTTQVQVI